MDDFCHFSKGYERKIQNSIFQPDWPEITNSAVYIDGVMTPYVYSGYAGGTGVSGGLQKFGKQFFQLLQNIP
ncbi:MAG: hypothetical protein IPF54_26015 [Draconibacterium sp.]|nr:hypothetical protein [Draconibacterium sp.]